MPTDPRLRTPLAVDAGAWLRRPDPAEGRPDRGVEANARLIGTTGVLLLGMLFAEGLTLLGISRLLGWHVAIGLALLPPTALKLGATFWRFGRYYLRDARYRAAGPPAPLLRALGPVVVLTTFALFATGVAAWLAGPAARTAVTLHQASFVLWFVAMAVHVLAHTVRALRLMLADVVPREHRMAATAGPLRQGLVLASLAGGVALGVAYRRLPPDWAAWTHRVRLH